MTMKFSNKGRGQAEVKPSQTSGFISHQLCGSDAAIGGCLPALSPRSWGLQQAGITKDFVT